MAGEPASAPTHRHTSRVGGWQLKVWTIMDNPSSGKLAKAWSVFMTVVILYSILNFTLAGVPGGLIYIGVWTNASTGEPIPFSVEEDFNVDSEEVYRSEFVHQASDEINDYRVPYRELEVFCIATFTFEFVVRLLTCCAGPGVVPFLKSASNIVDLVSILPFYAELIVVSVADGDGMSGFGFLQVLRLIRLTRITRIVKMSKNFEGLVVLSNTIYKSISALLMLFFFMAIFSVLFATLIYTCEPGNYDEGRRQYVREDGSASPFESIPASIWWTIVTMSTVGYGDHYPVSFLGRVVANITMTVSLIVLSLPITIIGANFDDEYQEMRNRKAEAKKAALAAKVKEARARAANLASQPSTAVAQSAIKFLRLVTKQVTCAPTLGREECKFPGAAPPAAAPPPRRHQHVDPVKAVESLIKEAHEDVVREVAYLIAKQERDLRASIQMILSQCVAGNAAASLQAAKSYRKQSTTPQSNARSDPAPPS
mmetsp:Transcript_37039/g.90346  ORF Transcript_37039/g.90346 Transcript_37039/m.90346 type:complete len:483 (+) Transcript_37039:102-1550(+)